MKQKATKLEIALVALLSRAIDDLFDAGWPETAEDILKCLDEAIAESKQAKRKTKKKIKIK